jgi:predicted  nucleic acid-binding Zn-ribbon protein
MKYLKKYILFKENFDIEDSDEESVKISKEELDKLKDKISEFNSKKSAIDTLYKSDNDDIESGLEKILGKDDRNPFLVKYSNISSMKRKVDKLQKKSDDKAVELSNFKDRLSISEDPESKSLLSAKIKEIENQISDIKSELDEVNKKLPEMEKELEEKINKSEDDMKNWIEKISSN